MRYLRPHVRTRSARVRELTPAARTPTPLHLIDRHCWKCKVAFLLLLFAAGYGLVQAVRRLLPAG